MMLPTIKISNRAAFLNIEENGEKRFQSVPPIAKKIPRYMQANAAWLAKDRNNQPSLPESIKDTSINMSKSRGSSLFPTMKKK